MRRVAMLAPWLAASAGLVFTLLTFWPGYMSWDSAFQWWQARHNRFEDSHPPLLAMIWQFSDRLLPGPGGMLALQALLVWSALAGFVAALPWRGGAKALAVVVLGLWPPLFGLLPHIWKDLWTLAAFGWAVAILAHELTIPRRSLRGVALVALAAACAFRHNAISGALPLLAWIAWREQRSWKPGSGLRSSRTMLVGLTSALLVLVWFAARWPSYDPRVRQVDRVLAVVTLWDAAAVSLAEGQLIYPPILIAPGTRLEHLRQHFQEFSNTTLFESGKFNLGVDGHYTLAERTALDELALTLPFRHPRAYFEHRLRLSELLFGWDRAALPDYLVFSPGLHGFGDNPNLPRPRSRLNAWVQAQLSALVDTPLFAGWIYLAACIAVLPFGMWQARQSPEGAFAAVVASSALTYALPFVVVAPAAEFRYLAWPLLASFCALLLLGWSWQQSRRC